MNLFTLNAKYNFKIKNRFDFSKCFRSTAYFYTAYKKEGKKERCRWTFDFYIKVYDK